MPSKLANDALRIWSAGVAAVQPELLFRESFHLDSNQLSIVGTRGDLFEADLNQVDRLWVVGGGKAGAAMGHALAKVLGKKILNEKLAGGILSVPGGCETPAILGTENTIQLVAGRPPAVNEPRAEGVAASRRMIEIVRQAGPKDLVICLLSGGASALLPLPKPPVTLEQKVIVAKRLAERGATIEQLNRVRQPLSLLKGGGLATACNAGRLLTLVISDVLGDSLSLIGSGPTVLPETGPDEAIAILKQLGLSQAPEFLPILEFLSRQTALQPEISKSDCQTLLLANNATAVDAAGIEAEKLGYNHAMTSSCEPEGLVEPIGKQLAEAAIRMRNDTNPRGPNCLITGGEPTVNLAPAAERGRGGRNQQLVLSALELIGDCRDIALLSGGTDGEDGPTDAAGAWIDSSLAEQVKERGGDIAGALRRNDAYGFFEPFGNLIMTGPTHTNVCDLRVVTVDR